MTAYYGRRMLIEETNFARRSKLLNEIGKLLLYRSPDKQHQAELLEVELAQLLDRVKML
jgi:hypothetical protein